MTNKAGPIPVVPYWIDFSDLYERADAISRAYLSGNLVFFVGSGASKAFSSEMPNWDQLLKHLQASVKVADGAREKEIAPLIKDKRYLLAAEALKNFGIFDQDNRDAAIDEKVRSILNDLKTRAPGDPTLHLAILDFAVPIFTTNYDCIIEDLIAKYHITDYKGDALTYEDQDGAATFLSPTTAHENYVFKLHGSLGRRRQRLILDEKDYADFYFRAHWPVSLQLLRHILATKMVVFIGFSLSDPDIMPILREATRYASSYQHIALMHSSAIGTSTEAAGLRASYKVDPILYGDHADLPLYVMEMRTFFPRESVALQIASERDTLNKAVAEIRQEYPERWESNCSTILFGSFARYGPLARKETDVDIFFLADDVPKDEVQSSRLRSEVAEAIIGRRIDATVMGRTQFGRLLRAGDPFASHVLVTGCRHEDPEDQFGILARGFRGTYDRNAVLNNAIDRYRMRWLRVCIYENRAEPDYLQACNQWSLAIMQYFVIKADYPLDSLLMVSVLANARHAMREFAKRFTDINENYFVSLMLQAKGIDPTSLGPSGQGELLHVSRPTIREMVQRFHRILSASYGKADLEMLLPGELIQSGDPLTIMDVYEALVDLLNQLTDDDAEDKRSYGAAIEPEHDFLEAVAFVGQTAGYQLTTLDYLFFFRLHRRLSEAGIASDEARRLELCKSLREKWLDEVAPSDGSVRSG